MGKTLALPAAPAVQWRMMTPEPIISCDHLSVRLHGRRVIDDLTWSLAEGDCAVILGPSGSGKTVFLHTLLGFHQPAAGSVQLKGLDHADRFQAAAVIFQEDALLDGRTVEANLALAREERADLLGGPFLPETEAAIDEALREVRLDPARVRRRLPGALSGGERRRVALARALIRRPRVLMADEPTTGLDPGSAGVIYDLLAEQIARRRMSAVIISHDPACASRLGRPVYYFSPTDGRLPCWTEPSAMQSAEARRRNLILWMEERLEEHLTRTAEPADPAPVGPSSPSLTELMPGRRAVETFLDGLGRAGLFLGHLAQPPATALLARALRAWGVGSIPLVGLIFFMLGIVMEVQAEAAVVDYGLSNRLPELVARSLLRLAPILTGLLAAGRCGSGICAETGWMQLGGSLRALRTLRIQPERTLFPPLFWALTLAVPLLALGGLMVGAMGALLTLASPFSQARISPEFFLSSYPTFLTPLEGVTVALKGALMGAGIAVIAFTGGAQPKRSTADLTRAMTGGLVTAFLWVTLVDTLMSLFLPT